MKPRTTRTARRRAWRPTYTLLDELAASATRPMAPAQYRHQLTRMHCALHAMQHDRAPTPDDWRLLADAYNLVEQLVLAGLAQDSGALLPTAQREIALAGARHVDDGLPLRLSGTGLVACKELLALWHEALSQLPARTVVQAHRAVERRMHAAYINPQLSSHRVLTV